LKIQKFCTVFETFVEGAMAVGTPATTLLAKLGVPHTLHEYQHDPREQSYGLEAASALGIDANRVFKTLCVMVDGQLCVGVVPVSGQLDLKAIAAALGKKKATMADPTLASRTTGYVLGGISPLGQRKLLATVIDESANNYEQILVSGGRRGLDIELAPTDLARIINAKFAHIRSAN
jgi:Cys-tRNA(Pro)/Cys-tRNA(Cys) deacylase